MGIKHFVRYTNTKGVCLFCGVFPIRRGGVLLGLIPNHCKWMQAILTRVICVTIEYVYYRIDTTSNTITLYP